MECPNAETLACYASDTLEDPDREQVAEHADRCTSCRQLLSRLVIESALERQVRGETISVGSDDSDRVEPSLRPGDVVSRYRIVSRLGRGAMGTVYCAFDSELERDVALKLTRNSASTPFQREAKALAKLDHENVVTVYDVGSHEGHGYIAMQLIAGIDFARWLAYRERSATEIVEVVRKVASGLVAAHDRGVVHRDVKPENILVGGDGKVAIGDFGLAIPNASPAARVAGTPVYMAPEVLAGGEATAASDQFSLAVTLFEALTGERPHDIEANSDEFAITKRKDIAASGIDRQWRRVIERALDDQPSARFGSVGAFAEALAPRSRRWPVVAAASVVAVVVVAGIFALQNRDDTSRCAQAGDDVAAIWNPAKAKLLAHRSDNKAVTTAIEKLGDYAGGLRAAMISACEDAERGRHDLALGVRRRDCLDARAASLSALVSALESGDSATLLKAAAAVRELPLASDCADLERLAETVPLPADAEARRGLFELRSHLDAIDAALSLGNENRAGQLVEEAAELAKSVEHAPTQARYSYARGEILHRRGELDAAEEALSEGTNLAAVGKDDALAARIWLTRAGVVGYKRRDTKRALAMLDTIRAAVARAGNRPELAANLANTEGLIRDLGGQYKQAAELYRRAHEIAAEAMGSDHPRAIAALRNLAIVQGELGDSAAVKETWERVLSDQRRVLGDQHPDVARTLGAMARVSLRERDFDSAERLSKQALESLRASLGAEHPSTLTGMQRLASVYSDRGRPKEALALDRQVLASTVKTYGGEHPRTLDAQSDLMGSLRLAGEHAEAVRVGRAAAEMAARVRPDDTRFLSRVHNNLGNALADSGKLEDAIAAMEVSLDYKRKAFKPGHPALISGAANLAEVLCDAKRYDDAVAVTDGVLAAARKLGGADLGWLLMTRSACYLGAGRSKQALGAASSGYALLFGSAGSALERGELSAAVAMAAIAAGDPRGPVELANAASHYREAGELGERALSGLRAWAEKRGVSIE